MYALIRSLLFFLPAETAQHLGFFCLRWLTATPIVGGLLRSRLRPRAPELRTSALGLEFPSPIGLAAGFDKDAAGYNALSDLGFGFVEVGTVTGQAQPGNAKPRLFRLKKDRAIINRMGFNNGGAEAMRSRLTTQRRAIVGVNIGKTKRVSEDDAQTDYEKSTRELAPLADYLVVNVSSPNTPGLRNLQAVSKLRPLLQAVRKASDEACAGRSVPLLVKIAPDLDNRELDEIVDLAAELQLDGIIATNTTIARNGLTSTEQEVRTCGAGGLSGAPLKRRSLEVLKRIRARVGPQLTIISVGGIESADDVWQRLENGANLVQLYTSFIYGGPLLPSSLNRELSRRLKQAKLASSAQLSTKAQAQVS